MGIAEHRSQAYEPGTDHFRAVRHGLHATCSGAWASGPATAHRRVSVGIQPHDDGRWPLRRRRHHRRQCPQVLLRILHRRPHRRQGGSQLRDGPCKRSAGDRRAAIRRTEGAGLSALETYSVKRNEIVAGTVSPSYILPINGLQRLEQLMDEYVGGIGAHYTTTSRCSPAGSSCSAC